MHCEINAKKLYFRHFQLIPVMCPTRYKNGQVYSTIFATCYLFNKGIDNIEAVNYFFVIICAICI